MPSTTQYEYLPLNGLFESNNMYCYGVVQQFAYSHNRSGIDGNLQHELRVTLTDEDLHPNEPVCTRIWSERRDKLPQVLRRGDIIRLHRIHSVKNRDDKMYLKGRIGVRGFHGSVWSGEHGESLQPRNTGDSATVTQHDKDRVQELRAFWARISDSVLDASEHLCRFERGKYRNILAQVVGIIVTHRGSTVLRVWDGTKLPYPTTKICCDLEMSDKSRINAELNVLVEDLSVDLFIYDEWVEKMQQLELQPNDFVYVGNVHSYFKHPSQIDDTLTLHKNGVGYNRCIKKVAVDDPKLNGLDGQLQAEVARRTSASLDTTAALNALPSPVVTPAGPSGAQNQHNQPVPETPKNHATTNSGIQEEPQENPENVQNAQEPGPHTPPFEQRDPLRVFSPLAGLGAVRHEEEDTFMTAREELGVRERSESSSGSQDVQMTQEEQLPKRRRHNNKVHEEEPMEGPSTSETQDWTSRLRRKNTSVTIRLETKPRRRRPSRTKPALSTEELERAKEAINVLRRLKHKVIGNEPMDIDKLVDLLQLEK